MVKLRFNKGFKEVKSTSSFTHRERMDGHCLERERQSSFQEREGGSREREIAREGDVTKSRVRSVLFIFMSLFS